MTHKEQLIYLIKKYYTGEYKIITFCDEYLRIFCDMQPSEADAKSEWFGIIKSLADECKRYTPYRSDLELSNFFVDDDKMHENIINAREELLKADIL